MMLSTEEGSISEERREILKQNESDYCSKVETTVLATLNLFFQYEQNHQISNGAFSSVFCVRQLKKKTRVLYAAKYLKANKEANIRETEILIKLRKCSQVVNLVEVFHCQFYTILVTEYLPGKIRSDYFERLIILMMKVGTCLRGYQLLTITSLRRSASCSSGRSYRGCTSSTPRASYTLISSLSTFSLQTRQV